ncbi:MAG TPA: hypothetical protein VFS32_11580 [Candidatus Limnocylindrales bacterium]|nr:hypothetical protein [Candidatus Limnocylindrales bacterium]
MAQPALTAGRTRRRALFGLLDADGWGWASLKAFVWFILIIFVLGYLPDRAYYFTVFPTIDLGILAWSPINLCPPENGALPCPAPAGATVAWQKNPSQITLPTPALNGRAVQAGPDLLYIGGEHGSGGGGATDEVLVAKTVGTGNFDAWAQGPKLPAPRTEPAVVVFNGVVYAFGGADTSGKAQADAYVLTPDQATGELGTWQAAADAKLPIDLPEPRLAASAVAVADGIVVAGGYDASGAPSKTVWKSTVDSQGKLGKWVEQAPLFAGQAEAIGVQAGSWLWLYGGVDESGNPTNLVQRGNFGTLASTGGAGAAGASPAASAAASPAASAGTPAAGNDVVGWQVANEVNLPAPRANPAGFTANGAIYLVGGDDGNGPRPELYWATPDGTGNFTEWKHLQQSDLPDGIEGSSAVVLGSDVVLVGGRATAGVTGNEARANLAPQPPFFQLGLVGATVPALKIEGEIGQQLGYLNAAGVATVDFVLLVLVGWAFAHRDQTRELFERIRRRRGR